MAIKMCVTSELKDWGSDKPLGEWEGVSIDSQGNVIGLNLYEKKIKALPSSLEKLQRLECLELEKTGLEVVPACLGKLKALRELNISGKFHLFLLECKTFNLRQRYQGSARKRRRVA